MSVQADDARAKVVHCEVLDNKQKAKMLLLINTKPDTTMPVFTGVPDFLLGHTLSLHLEGLTAGTMPTAHAIALFPDTSSAIRYSLVTFHIDLQTSRAWLKQLKQHPDRWPKSGGRRQIPSVLTTLCSCRLCA